MSEIYWKCTWRVAPGCAEAEPSPISALRKPHPAQMAEGVQRLEEQVYLRESLGQKTEDGGKSENFITESGSSVQHCMSLPNVREVSLNGKWERAVRADPSHMLLASQVPQSVSLCSPLSSLIS